MSGYTDEVAIETHDVMEQANIAEEKVSISTRLSKTHANVERC